MLIEYPKIHNVYKFDESNKEFTRTFYDAEVEYLKDLKRLATEKYDGMNIRVYYDGYSVSWYGRGSRSKIPDEVNDLLKKYFEDTTIIFEQHFGDCEVELFLECYGGKVNGSKKRGRYGGIDETLIGLDVMINQVFLDRTKIDSIFEIFGIKSVQLIEFNNLEETMKYVENKSFRSDDEDYFEGFVATPLYPLYIKGSRIVVKIKCSLFNKVERLPIPTINEENEENQQRKKRKKLHNVFIISINKDNFDKEFVHIQKDTFEKLNETKNNFEDIKIQDMVIIKCNDDLKVPYTVANVDYEKEIVELVSIKKKRKI